MKKAPNNFGSAVVLIRITLAVALVSAAAILLASSFMAQSAPPAGSATNDQAARDRKPQELAAIRAPHSFNGDLRTLPYTAPLRKERPEFEPPTPNPRFIRPEGGTPSSPLPESPLGPVIGAPAPAPNITFNGLDFANWGAGFPPDPNGDVGPNYYIQTINTSIGIYNKTTGAQVAAFTFDTFMSQGSFGNNCDTHNFGDPIVLYDSFEGRWFISDFAFTVDGSGNINMPYQQCIAVSKSSDPVGGGWNFYSITISDLFGDYPKFGVWTDGIYVSANMFSPLAGGSFSNARVWALNKSQMYAGAPTVQIVSFDVADAAEFTLLPSNARLQTGTPPAGRPNFFVSTWEYLNAQEVYKFHVDWSNISLSTFTGPDLAFAATSWPNAAVPNAPTPGNSLDVLQIRNMHATRYTNIGGVESLWATHTVRRANTSGSAASRWYQIPVTGGTVGANDTQGVTWDPDAANTFYRFVPSLAVDRMGNMALGYSKSNSTTNPQIKYAGRLSTDPINTFSQTEQTLFDGTGTQTGTCGGGTCTRWGDYTAMSLDPDGCTFWYTNEYYAVSGLNYLTRIGSFTYSSCTPVGAGGTVQGTVTDAGNSNPLSGATVMLGSRMTTTDGSGFYQFLNIPAGTYPSLTASYPGYNSSTATNIAVTDAGTWVQDFPLTASAMSACLTDTTQADFQAGIPNTVDLTTSPGNVILSADPTIDQQNTNVTSSGFGFNDHELGRPDFHSSRHGPTHAGGSRSVLQWLHGYDPEHHGRNQGHERQPAHGRRSRDRDDPRVFEWLRRILCRELWQPNYFDGWDAICRDIPREFESLRGNLRLRRQHRQPLCQWPPGDFREQRRDLGGPNNRHRLQDLHEHGIRCRG